MRTAVIGVGPQGHRVIDVIKQMPSLLLSAVVDRREEALASKAIPSTASRYRSVEELWTNEDIELVCITTNGASHAELAICAMEGGARYVMVEKPMACSIAECESMVAKTKETGTRLAVDHPRRYAPIYRWLKNGVQSGQWGELRAIWIQRPGIGLGCLATHSFDLACFMSGEDVRQVSAWIDKPLTKNPRGDEFIDPGGLVVLEMMSGSRTIIAQLEDGAGPMSVELDLTGARIRYDEQGHLEVVERDLTVFKGPNQSAAYRLLENPDHLPVKRSLKTEICSLLQELISDQAIESNGLHGLASIEILIAAYLSHQRGHIPVSLQSMTDQDKKFWVPIT